MKAYKVLAHTPRFGFYRLDGVDFEGKKWLVTGCDRVEGESGWWPKLMIRFDHLQFGASSRSDCQYAVLQALPASLLEGEPHAEHETLRGSDLPAPLQIEFPE